MKSKEMVVHLSTIRTDGAVRRYGSHHCLHSASGRPWRFVDVQPVRVLFLALFAGGARQILRGTCNEAALSATMSVAP
jgi:hypothetical protein